MKYKPKLSSKDLTLLRAFSKSCRHSILAMTTNAQSGHPGGSLSCIDYLALLYTQIITKTGEPVIVSNGHISPAVYSVLAEMGYTSKQSAIKGFRKIGQPYEGHVTRHVPGVWYGTGPLGCGISAATGFALAEKYNASVNPLVPGKGKPRNVYALLGDGESEEGQVYEMMNFAAKYKLDNLIAFMDYNKVQLSDGLKQIMPFDPKAIFTAGGWNVIDVDGHDFHALWEALKKSHNVKGIPTLLFAHTIMGKGVDFMEKEGLLHKATWHGKAAKSDEAKETLSALEPNSKEKKILQAFRKTITWKPKKPSFPRLLSPMPVKIGKPILYKSGELTDCRSAYGKALLDLARLNKNIIALTADLAGSVRTDYVKDQIPERHIEVGIAEQQMLSCSGGLSLSGMIPFCSTFGAFMTSRAKDQVRVNDINDTNVKMVATHCGLSVGEDGPTHQAIDDMNSMLGLFNTMQIEPADPNHCDRMIRYIAAHYGNFYMRMGRHKIPVLTAEDGSPFFDEKYTYYYGRCDVLRKGTDITIAACGGVANEALKAADSLKKEGIKAELLITSSIKQFDKPLIDSIQKTKRLISVEDHNVNSGLGFALGSYLTEQGIHITAFKKLGVKQYQLSGTAEELYNAAEISAPWIEKYTKNLL
ncbi:MAG: transketolase [Candidatus Magasanikbacteria bacterium]|nr:transketolase [Candidatus Magasanikbacteria bacterium]